MRSGGAHCVPPGYGCKMDLDQINPQLTVASHRIPYLLVGNDRQQWFQGKPLAEVLEYLNTRHAVANNVREDHRMTLQDLRGVYGTAKVISGGGQPGGPPCAIQPGTVYVDEAGMWSLLIRSNKPEAAGIQDWLFSEVLPEIRRTGGYRGTGHVITSTCDVMPTLTERVQMAEGTMRTYQMMLDMNTATETDRVLFADVARNAVMPLSSVLPIVSLAVLCCNGPPQRHQKTARSLPATHLPINV